MALRSLNTKDPRLQKALLESGRAGTSDRGPRNVYGAQRKAMDAFQQQQLGTKLAFRRTFDERRDFNRRLALSERKSSFAYDLGKKALRNEDRALGLSTVLGGGNMLLEHMLSKRRAAAMAEERRAARLDRLRFGAIGAGVDPAEADEILRRKQYDYGFTGGSSLDFGLR